MRLGQSLLPDVRARLDMAESLYESGKIVEAISMFESLAKEGVATACQYLGMLYKHGEGVSPDAIISAYWYRREAFLLSSSSENGDSGAQLALGKLLQYGATIEPDPTEAMRLFEQAAERGNADAMNHLATIYEFGWCGRATNIDAMLNWLSKAVELEQPEAMYRLAILMRRDGDSSEGRELLQKAAAKGFWPAQELMREL